MVTHEATDHRVNWILNSLPAEDYRRLHPHLEPIELPHGKVIQAQHDPVIYIYFPENAMVSLVARMASGATVEVGVVGHEGIIGLGSLMGVDAAAHESMVQIPDGGRRIRAETLRAEFARGGALQQLLLKYMHAVMTQISQTAACNRLHTIEERLARWLLMSHDRTASDVLPLTHEFLSVMLGTRRAGITGAAINLQAEGFINYTRGQITIADRPGLENFSCECYAIVRQEFNRLRPPNPPSRS